MKKSHIAILVFTFLLGLVYQPSWIYQNFYSNPRWVDDKQNITLEAEVTYAINKLLRHLEGKVS
jgi:hypothetical protein